ncbi:MULTISPECIES: hypothetical protein [unclassified Nostoc]|uniref:hypothetical protein n=1 Tax=unclassified Nostoc TaxID=2593658 RepID=UPI002AD32955|nr:hypothetical protein [Nostoc sp. ChiQUE02]MDZ8228908.1 hypothetical protein [Nostoc sp. ChiQUE02]
MRFIRSRPLVQCLRRASLREATPTPTPSLDNKLGDVYDGLRLRIKPSNPLLTIRVLCRNPDDCVLAEMPMIAR